VIDLHHRGLHLAFQQVNFFALYSGRGYKYVEETIKMLPAKPEPVLFAKILHQVARLGRSHALQPSFSSS
jgi:hypothetical protein